jgi:hypothetical protein
MIRMRVALALSLVLAGPIAAGTTDVAPPAQDRAAFEARAAAQAPRAGAAYPYVRCAALFRALRLHAREAATEGPPRGGAALAQPTAGERALLEEAVRARLERRGMSRAVAGPQSEADVAAVAALYAERFDARDAGPWWDDALIETDLRACGLLLGSLGPAAGPAPSR